MGSDKNVRNFVSLWGTRRTQSVPQSDTNPVVTKNLQITRQRIMILKKLLVLATRFWATKSLFLGLRLPPRKWIPDSLLLWLLYVISIAVHVKARGPHLNNDISVRNEQLIDDLRFADLRFAICRSS